MNREGNATDVVGCDCDCEADPDGRERVLYLPVHPPRIPAGQREYIREWYRSQDLRVIELCCWGRGWADDDRDFAIRMEFAGSSMHHPCEAQNGVVSVDSCGSALTPAGEISS